MKIKCSVCQQKKEAASPGDDMCAGCRESFDRVYGRNEDKTMAQKKTGKAKKGAKPSKINQRKPASPPKAARSTAPEPEEKDEREEEEEEAPESNKGSDGTDHDADDHGGTPHDADPESEEEGDEEDEEDEEDEAEEPGDGSPSDASAAANGASGGDTSGKKSPKKTYQWRMRQLSPAKQMIAKLTLMEARAKRFSTSVSGWERPQLAVLGAECLEAITAFKAELVKLPDTFKPPRGTTVAVASKALEEGAKVTLREKHRKSYDDVLDEAQMTATFTVVNMRKSGKVVLDVPTGEGDKTMRLVMPRGHLLHATERDESAAAQA